MLAGVIESYQVGKGDQHGHELSVGVHDHGKRSDRVGSQVSLGTHQLLLKILSRFLRLLGRRCGLLNDERLLCMPCRAIDAAKIEVSDEFATTDR